jgi:hypothetical protein
VTVVSHTSHHPEFGEEGETGDLLVTVIPHMICGRRLEPGCSWEMLAAHTSRFHICKEPM